MFSFCVAEFPQFVDVPIPVHLHIIPGNRVRLPFTPLPRHQWSHASESKTTLSNLCFSLLVKSFTIFVANINNKKLLIGSFVMTLHTLVERWSTITLFKIDGQWILIISYLFKLSNQTHSVLLVQIGWSQTWTCLSWLYYGVTGGLEFMIVSAGQHRLALRCREDFEWRFSTDLEEIWGVGYHRAAVQ